MSLALCAGVAACGTGSPSQETQETTETAEETAFAGLTTLIDTSQQFTDRDLTQTVDLSQAQEVTVENGKDITIDQEGVYRIRGSAKEASIVVEAEDTAKVQLVLDGVTITNESKPAIYVKSADKIFVTTTEGSENALSVTGTFEADGETNTDAVIFAKEDIVLNGLGALIIESTNHGITGKDDLKITGGTYTITATGHGVEAHNSIRMAGGTVTIEAGKDGFHAEDEDDLTTGYVYIAGGDLNVTAGDDGIRATTYAIVDGGTLAIQSLEGIESTYVQINGGRITIDASDDGINAAEKTTAVAVKIEIHGGTIVITMAQGDTDALDANGDLQITGGEINITAQFAFDFDGTGELTGGTVTVNGEEVTQLTNSMQGGGGGGFGEPGGQGGPDGPGVPSGGPEGRDSTGGPGNGQRP